MRHFLRPISSIGNVVRVLVVLFMHIITLMDRSVSYKFYHGLWLITKDLPRLGEVKNGHCFCHLGIFQKVQYYVT